MRPAPIVLPIILSIACLGLPAYGLAAGGEADPYERALQVQDSASLEELFSLYARSAEMGNAIAQYNVAMMYCNGEAVNVDYQQAAYWFGQSAAQEFAPAQYRLGEMHYFGRGGLERNLAMALSLFTTASDNGDPDAQMNLAMLLGSGEGVPLDTERALEWMSRARRSGHEAAREYRRILEASPDGRFSAEERRVYWDQQRLFWIEEAAEYGVREAEEALTVPDPPE